MIPPYFVFFRARLSLHSRKPRINAAIKRQRIVSSRLIHGQIHIAPSHPSEDHSANPSIDYYYKLISYSSHSLFHALPTSISVQGAQPSHRQAMDTIYEKAGKRLKELRSQQGWTQQQLAEKASISVAFLSFIEQGRRKGSLQTYANLSKALGLELSELLRSDKAGKPALSELPQAFPGLSVAESQTMLKLVKKMKR